MFVYGASILYIKYYYEQPAHFEETMQKQASEYEQAVAHSYGSNYGTGLHPLFSVFAFALVLLCCLVPAQADEPNLSPEQPEVLDGEH